MTAFGDEVLYDETETVALSGPHLAELLAASGETPAAAWDLDVSVETTVVIPGSRVKPVPAPPRSSGSIPALAYCVAQPIADATTMAAAGATMTTPKDPPRRSLARDATAFSLAALGLLMGLTAATALTAETTPAPSRVAATEGRHVLANEATPLAGATRQKAMGAITKRPRGMSIGAARSNAAASTKARTPDAGEDPQLVEDQRLVLAAQLERSL